MFSPANQYTNAGMIAKLICTEAIRQRPAMRARTSRSASSLDSERKRSTSSGARPIVLPSRMPDTESDSSTSVRHVGQASLAHRLDAAALAADALR